MKPGTPLLTGLLIGGTLLSHHSFAAEWERSGGVSLNTFYSENICLSTDEPVGRSATTVTPTLRISGQGARANLSLNAAITYNYLADSSLECNVGQSALLTNRQAVIPSLRYLGELELVENWLTLESDAVVSRNPINPFAAGGTNRFDGRNNINITTQYGAGARVQRRIADNADLRLRYYHNEQQNAVSLFGDSSEDRGEFNLGSRQNGNRLSLGIAGRYSKFTFDPSELRPAFDNTLSSAEATAALQLVAGWQIEFLLGQEWNQFISTSPDIDGSYWDVGLRWAPIERVNVSLGYGERFFGRTPRMSVSYRHRRSTVVVDYARSLTIPRNLRASSQVSGDISGDIVVPEFDQLPGDPLTVNGEPTFIGDTPIINERLNVRYSYSARRSTITVRATDSRQLRTADSGEATFTDLNVVFTRSLSAALSGNIRVLVSEREGQGGNVGFFGQNSETWRAGVGLSRSLGPNTSMNLGYDYTRRDSDADFILNAFNQFEENRVTLSLQHQF